MGNEDDILPREWRRVGDTVDYVYLLRGAADPGGAGRLSRRGP